MRSIRNNWTDMMQVRRKGDRKRKYGTEIKGQFLCAPMPRDPKCAVRMSSVAQRRTVDEHLAVGEQDCAKESRRDGEWTIDFRLGGRGFDACD